MAHPSYRLTQAGVHVTHAAAALHNQLGTDDPLADRGRQQRLDTNPLQHDHSEHTSTATPARPAVIWHDRQKRPQIKGAATVTALPGPGSFSAPVSSQSPPLLSPPPPPPSPPPASTPIGSAMRSELSAPLLPPLPPLTAQLPSAAASSTLGDVLIGIGSDGSATLTSALPPPHRPLRLVASTGGDTAAEAAVGAVAGGTVAAASRRVSSSNNGRPSRSTSRKEAHREKEWLRQLKQEERSLQTDEDSKQREEQKQEEQEAEAEEEEDEDEDEQGEQSDDTSSSSSSDSSGDEDGEGGADEVGHVSKPGPPTRRSSAADDALRITIIGELVSRHSKVKQATTSSPPLATHSQHSPAAAQQLQHQPSTSTPATTERTVTPLVSSQPLSQPAVTSSPGSIGSSTPFSAPATATISPPFPAPAIVRSAPTLSSVASEATSAASTPPVSSLPSPARMLNRIASGELIGSCRVFHSVEALVRSRYDSNYDRPDQPVWISVENADNPTIELIGQHFDLHPLTVEDVQSKHTREKLEIFQHYLFLVFHSLQHTDSSGRERRLRRAKRRRRRRRRLQQRRLCQADASVRMDGTMESEHDEGEWSDDDGRELHTEAESESMRTVGIKLIVFPHLVLSFTTGLRFPTLLAVRHRLRRVYDNRLESTAWIIHAMLDSIVDALLPVVDGTVVEVDALEDLIYVLSGSEHRDLLKRMGLTRRRLSFLRQRLWSKRDILMSLIGKDWQLFLAGVQIPYLRDVYDHVVTMLVRHTRHTTHCHTLGRCSSHTALKCAVLRSVCCVAYVAQG